MDFSLETPGGAPITPGTVHPEISYTWEDGLAQYSIVGASAASGDWIMSAEALPVDSVLAGGMAAGAWTDTELEVELLTQELRPSELQQIWVTVTSGGVPVTTLTVEATVTGPDGQSSTLALPYGAGVYSGVIAGNADQGLYTVAVHAEGMHLGAPVECNSDGYHYEVMMRPDLQILPSDIVVVDSLGLRPSVTVHGTFRNISDQTADTVRVRFLEEETRLVFADSIVTDVGPGDAVTLQAEWNVRLNHFTYALGMRVDVLSSVYDTDPPDVIFERNLDNNEAFAFPPAVSVPEPGPGAVKLGLLRVSPNPFAQQVQVEFRSLAEEHVRVSIHDVAGRRVAVVHDGVVVAGRHLVHWNGRTDDGRRVGSGVYFVRLSGGLTGLLRQRVVLLR